MHSWRGKKSFSMGLKCQYRFRNLCRLHMFDRHSMNIVCAYWNFLWELIFSPIQKWQRVSLGPIVSAYFFHSFWRLIYRVFVFRASVHLFSFVFCRWYLMWFIFKFYFAYMVHLNWFKELISSGGFLTFIPEELLFSYWKNAKAYCACVF